MYAEEKLDYELKCAGSVSEGLYLHSWSIVSDILSVLLLKIPIYIDVTLWPLVYRQYNPFVTFRGPYIVIYCYTKSPRDALFLKFILIKNSTCFGKIYCPSSGVSILYTQQWVSTSIYHASSVDCLLARSG